MKRHFSRYATLLVLAHFLALIAHKSAHASLGIGVSQWQYAFIISVIFAAPLLSAVLLWTRHAKPGIVLLGVSISASLVFGLTYHFFVAGTDNVMAVRHNSAGPAFITTAVLLCVIETWICGLCFRQLTRLTSKEAMSNLTHLF